MTSEFDSLPPPGCLLSPNSILSAPPSFPPSPFLPPPHGACPPDCLFKDVIEPLETIGVTITPTAKTSVTELGVGARGWGGEGGGRPYSGVVSEAWVCTGVGTGKVVPQEEPSMATSRPTLQSFLSVFFLYKLLRL